LPVGVPLERDERAPNSPILITESPASSPRPAATQPNQEGGDAGQKQILSDEVQKIVEPVSAKLKMVASIAEDFPTIVAKAVGSATQALQGELSKLRDENSALPKLQEELSKLREENSATQKLQEELLRLRNENSLIIIEAERVAVKLALIEMEKAAVVDAMNTELQLARGEATESNRLVQKLNLEKGELQGKIVPLRTQVNELGAIKKADTARMEKLEKRLSEREVLLGEVEKARDGLKADLDQAQADNKKVAEDLLQAQQQIKELEQQDQGLKRELEELQLSSAQYLVEGFGAAREQVACLFPDLDLSRVSLANEVVDGEVVPVEI